MFQTNAMKKTRELVQRISDTKRDFKVPLKTKSKSKIDKRDRISDRLDYLEGMLRVLISESDYLKSEVQLLGGAKSTMEDEVNPAHSRTRLNKPVRARRKYSVKEKAEIAKRLAAGRLAKKNGA